MPKDKQIDPTKNFAPRILPWLLGLLMLAVYIATLNRWITLANIVPVAKASGFTWQPGVSSLMLFLLEYPFRWLPAAQVPLAMNLFSAVCAAALLALLARCVAILPHDRTEMERTREHSDFSFLTTRSAWFPPALAVVMFGLQIGVWMHATSFTGEIIYLLHFAVIIWLLLEYRLDEREGRLILAGLIYGLGIPDNWALIGFLPAFIAALIWLRGFQFFTLRFLGGMVLSGLTGMLSALLLLSVIGKFSSDIPITLWGAIKPTLQLDWFVTKTIGNGNVRLVLLLMSATTFLPLLMTAIRWSATFGDASRMGTSLSNYMFHAVHAVFFTVCIWIMFDPPFSPNHLSYILPFPLFSGAPCLTLLYLAALCIGYYCGYYLLVFGKKPTPTRRNMNPLPTLPGKLDVLSPYVYWGTYAAAALIVFTLVYHNLPQIRALNDDTLLRYAKWTEQNLPAGGGILLSDSDGYLPSQQTRTLLLQAAIARSGRSKDFLVADTLALNWAPYHAFLHKQAPNKWPLLVGAQFENGVPQASLMNLLDLLSKSNTICYLNPSFGYYFENFYQEPHGLVYAMKKLPEDTLLPPPLSTNLIEENQKFWVQVADAEFARLTNAIVEHKAGGRGNLPDWILLHFHGKSDPNPNAIWAANRYSRSLNTWGVQLQRANLLPAAADCFANAKIINPDNLAAAVNLEFNELLQSGAPITIDPTRASEDQFGKYRNWNALLNATGPFDEPDFVYRNGGLLAQNMLTRQSIAQFTRVRQIAPENLPARFMLARLYLLNRLPNPALEALNDPLTHPRQFGLNETNSTGLNIIAAAAHFQKNETARGIELFEQEMSRHPTDTNLLVTIAQAYFVRGLYTNALQIINRQLEENPYDPLWLFGQGNAHLRLTNYDQAILSFTRILELSTNEPSARFNRAFAYLKTDRLKEARTDYTALQSAFTNSFQIAYGLGEVAWQQHDTNEAIRNYKLFLDNAPTNSPDIKTVRERLNSLKR
jgi:tetratricopeptide (TPR) repeat protein